MKKIEEIKKYLSDNSSRSKEFLINRLAKKFEISEKSAENYYYVWKKEFMKASEEEYGSEESQKVAEEVIRQNEKALEEVSKNKKDENKLKIKKVELEGEFGNYIKEGEKVISGEITFNSLEDVEAYYQREIETFNKRIEEIREVYKF